MELAQKGNQYLKGKSEAFAGFRDVLAEEIVKSMPNLKEDVKQVLDGIMQKDQKMENGEVQMT